MPTMHMALLWIENTTQWKSGHAHLSIFFSSWIWSSPFTVGSWSWDWGISRQDSKDWGVELHCSPRSVFPLTENPEGGKKLLPNWSGFGEREITVDKVVAENKLSIWSNVDQLPCYLGLVCCPLLLLAFYQNFCKILKYNLWSLQVCPLAGRETLVLSTAFC